MEKKNKTGYTKTSEQIEDPAQTTAKMRIVVSGDSKWNKGRGNELSFLSSACPAP